MREERKGDERRTKSNKRGQRRGEERGISEGMGVETRESGGREWAVNSPTPPLTPSSSPPSLTHSFIPFVILPKSASRCPLLTSLNSRQVMVTRRSLAANGGAQQAILHPVSLPVTLQPPHSITQSPATVKTPPGLH